jgi:hypothetical protein
LYVPSLQIRRAKSHLSRTAVSNSWAENRNPPSPDIESTGLPGRTRQAAMALARSISNAIDGDDIQRNWVKVASNRNRTSSSVVSLGQAVIGDEPIDGLDILSIEPHLIAQQILECQDEVGDIVLPQSNLEETVVWVRIT